MDLKQIIEQAEQSFEEKFPMLEISGFNKIYSERRHQDMKSFLSSQISKAVAEVLKEIVPDIQIGFGFMPLENEAMVKNIRANLKHNEKESEIIGFNSCREQLIQKIKSLGIEIK